MQSAFAPLLARSRDRDTKAMVIKDFILSVRLLATFGTVGF